MSRIAVTGNASGTGTFTISAPNGNTDRTLTIPDVDGSVVTANASGNVGIGTSSPNFPLSFGANLNKTIAVFENAGADVYGIGMGGNGSAGDPYRTKVFANGFEYLSVDYAGRVTMPYQPVFYADTGAVQQGAQFVVQFTNAIINVGGHYNTSNFRFTAPVAGRYKFDFNAMSAGTSTNRFGLFLNGVLYSGQRYAVNQQYENFSGVWIVEMAVNDYVTVESVISSEGSVHSNFRSLAGQLIS